MRLPPWRAEVAGDSLTWLSLNLVANSLTWLSRHSPSSIRYLRGNSGAWLITQLQAQMGHSVLEKLVSPLATLEVLISRVSRPNCRL